MRKNTAIFILSFLLVSNGGWAASPPSESTPQARLWEKLSGTAARNINSQSTLHLMNLFIKKYPDDPNSVNVRYMYSERDFLQGRYKNAAVGFEKFIAKYPKHELSDSAAYRIGESYYNLKAYNSALVAWQRVIDDYPKSALVPPAMEWVGQLNMRFSEWGKADELFKRLKRKYPKYAANPVVQENHGIVQYFLEDYSDSAEMLAGIDRGKGAYFRGLSLFSLKLYEDSVAALKNVAADKSGPYRETAAFLKAEGFYQNKNYTLADSEFAQFVRRFPNSDLRTYAELRRGACALLTNEPGDAVAAIERAHKGKTPADVRVYGDFVKGSALLDMRRYSSAVTVFGRVATKKDYPPLAAAALLRRAWAYKNLGNYSAMDTSLKSLEERYPTSPQMALGRFLQGARLYERGKWEEAGSRFESAVMEFPYSIISESALALMTVCYTRADRLDQLVTSGNAALKLFEDNFSAQSLYWRAQSYFFIGKAYFELGRHRDAIPYFEKIVEKFGDHILAPRAQLMLAWCLNETRRYDKAREKAMVLIEGKKTPGFLKTNASYLVAVSYFNDKKYDKALTEFEKFLKKNPKDDLAPKVQYLMGLSFHQKKVFGSAIKEWQKTIDKYPHHPLAEDAYLHIGDLYFKAEDFAKAAKYFAAFRKKWPKSPYGETAMWQEVQSYYNGKDDEKAIKVYPLFIERYPESDNIKTAENQLELVYYRRGAHGDPDKLMEFLKRYPDSPFAPAARYQLGDMAIEQKAWHRAIQEMEQFVRDYPSDKQVPEALYGLGIAYENAGQPEKAMIQYNILMERYKNKPGAMDAAFRLGSLHFKAQRYAESAKAFEFALKKRPNKTLKANLYYNLALSYENMGEAEPAAKAYGNFANVTADKDQKRDALMSAGLLLKNAEEFRKAIPYFKKLLSDAGKKVTELQVVNLLGGCYQAAGKNSQAIKMYDKLVAMEPVDHDLRLAGLAQLAYLYEQSHKMEKAVRIYEKISVSGGKKEWVDAAKNRVVAIQKTLDAMP